MTASLFKIIVVEISLCVVFSIEKLNGRRRTILLPETVFDSSMCFINLTDVHQVCFFAGRADYRKLVALLILLIISDCLARSRRLGNRV